MKNSLSKAEKRVAIAKDVIAQIKADRLNVLAGNTYVEISNKLAEELKPKTQLQKALKTTECTVCALGACFISAVRKYNKCTAEDVRLGGRQKCWCGYPDCISSDSGRTIDRELLTKKLRAFFTNHQMDMIEHAFESEWRDDYSDDTERLTAIMKNIIRNKGTFKPGDIR